jgi:uncharacterized protein
MVMDCHIHLLPREVRQDRSRFFERDSAFASIYSLPKARLASEAQIMQYLDDSGIDRAVVFGFPWEDPELVKQNNDEIWDFYEQNPRRIIPFAVLSPGGGDVATREAQRTLSAGFGGIGELAMYHGGWSEADFEALTPSLELAEQYHAPVLIHVNEPVGHHYPGKIAVDFQGLLRLISDHPLVDFILAHFGGGIFVYGLMPEVGKILGRTYLDTAASPFLYDSRVFDIACRIMGPEKILFGSDYPLLPLSRYLKELDKTSLDVNVKERILGGNLRRLLDKS